MKNDGTQIIQYLLRNLSLQFKGSILHGERHVSG